MTKHEILLRKKTYESAYAKKFIKKITNNYYECNFDNNLEFFYKYDGHPNSNGYKYLFNCISNIFGKTIIE